MGKYCITVSRQFASMGRSIAMKLAEELEIPFYDRDIVEETAKRMKLPVSLISDEEEKNRYFARQYPLGIGIQSMQDEIFMIQKNIIEDLVAKESCIIVGRCADGILRKKDNVLSVYIYAPYEARYDNCINQLGMVPETAEKMIKKIDKSRTTYHKRYCEGYVNELSNKDIAIDSSIFGIEESAKLIKHIVETRGLK